MTRMSPEEQTKAALRVTWLAAGANALLAVGKGLVGVFSGSAALLADAAHSAGDLISDGVTLWAVRASRVPRDSDHPYGHGKFESVGTLIVALLLLLTAVGIGRHAVGKLDDEHVPGVPALWMAVASIIVNEALYHVTVAIGRKTNSKVLMANAWHHRSDAFSSIAALVGIAAARLGFPLFDPIAGLFVAALILKTGISMAYDAFNELTDRASGDLVKRIRTTVDHIEEVEEYHMVRARRMGPYYLVDMHVQVPSKMSVSVAHQISERVEKTILNHFPEVNEVLVHIDAEDDSDHEIPGRLMRPQAEIEADIRNALNDFEEIESVTMVTCHYLKKRVTALVHVRMAPHFTLAQVKITAERARRAVEQIRDIYRAEIHLDLADPKPPS